MKYHFLTLIITLSMLLTVACDNGSTRENLEHAELAIGICDNLREIQNHAETMDAVTLCNLSMLYMKLSDNTDREDNIGLARQCYIDAYSTDSAQAHEYYDHVPVEDLPHLSLLSSLFNSTTGIRAEAVEEHIDEGDSISGLN